MIYDIAIIGGGPGGYSAAFEAVRYHMSVVLFEKDRLGGTCLNRGCIPTKYLGYVAGMVRDIKKSTEYGIDTSFNGISVSSLQKKNESIMSDLRDGLNERLIGEGVDIIHGLAELVDAHNVVCDGRTYEFGNVIIATGSKTYDDMINPYAITSDEVLSLDHIPDSVSILGGGVIAVEFADIFSGLGSDVTMYLRGNRILRGWDRDISTGMTQHLKKNGVKIVANCSPDTFSAVNDSCVLQAFGRHKAVEGLNYSLFDIGDDGGIIVDKHGMTRTRDVFAIGDVVSGSRMLAHTAMNQGIRTIRYIAGENLPEEPSVVSCIYTSPESASVGITKDEAEKRGLDVIVGKYPMYSNARTLIAGGERGFIKVVADRNSHIIMGAQMMCDRASDMIGEFAMAIDNSMTAEDMLCTVRPHPSYSEAITEALSSLCERFK